MKRIFQILFSFLVLSGITFAQDMGRDLTQTPSNFNNPEYVYGPALENPNLGFLESFEGTTFPPAGWLKANPDGGTGWERQLDGTTPIPGWTGGTITVPTGGGSAVAFCTWNTGGAVSNDQWLITPQITNVQPGDILSFWMQIPGYTNGYLEQVDIRISTTGTNVADFSTIVEALVFPAGSPDTAWIQYTYQLTNYVSTGSDIYIGFREHVLDNFNDGAAVLLDLVEVTQGGSGNTFFDDFEAYTAGVQLCLQTTNWEPWVGSVPGSAADPYVSSAYSFSGLNSVVIVSNNDVVRRHGPQTTGKWYISFLFYIPTGNSGYFNTMNDYDPNPNVWGMDSFFDVGGVGRLDTTGGGGGTYIVNFTWTPDQWNQVVVIIDLDAPTPTAEYWIGTSQANFTQVATWGWTQAGTKPTQLAVNDLFGAAATDEMYVDDFYFGDAMPPIIPVELTSFTGNVNNLGQVVLNWETATEINNQGFEIERRTEASEYRTVGFVEGYGTTTEPRSYIYTDVTADNGINYYRLKQVDYNGTYAYSDEVEVDVTGPLTFDLAQNYPNPFNPSTSIKYSVPEAGNVRLSVYNLVGEEVAVLVNGFSQSGFYEVSFNASNLPSGVYLYKLQSANSVQTKKMMLLK